MFEAHARREEAEAARRTRLAMIAGAWANTNFDMQENDRMGWLETIDHVIEDQIGTIYGETLVPVEEIPWEDPLFGAMRDTVYSQPLSEEEIARERARRGDGFEVLVVEEEL